MLSMSAVLKSRLIKLRSYHYHKLILESRVISYCGISVQLFVTFKKTHLEVFFLILPLTILEGMILSFFKYCILYLKVSGRFDLYAAFYEDTLINLVLTIDFLFRNLFRQLYRKLISLEHALIGSFSLFCYLFNHCPKCKKIIRCIRNACTISYFTSKHNNSYNVSCLPIMSDHYI